MPDLVFVPVSWREDPAFLAWLDKTVGSISAAIVAVTTSALPFAPTWYIVLGAVAADGLVAARHVFFKGPDLLKRWAPGE